MKQTATRSILSAISAWAALYSVSAHAAVSHICPQLDRSEKTLSVRVGTGCITGMARFNDHDLKLQVDQNRARITLTGDINFHPIQSRIVTADCAGAQSITLDTEKIEPRRYTLLYAGQYLGVVDFVDQADQPPCLMTSRQKLRSETKTINQQTFKEWSAAPDAEWSAWRGDSIASLLEPLLRDHPESLEGRPQVELRIEKRTWQRTLISARVPEREPFLAVWITRRGFADDSVSGDRSFLAVKQSDGMWRVDKMWRQQMCARGKYAGQWTATACP